MKSFLLDYVWLDGVGNLRSKIKVVYNDTYNFLQDLKNIPDWNYDGSSTNQADGINSEIILSPKSIYQNPHYINRAIIWCDTWVYNDSNVITPALYNNRHYATTIFNNNTVNNSKPWYGLEQEYFLRPTEISILDYNQMIMKLHKAKAGIFYCGVGGTSIVNVQRKIVEEHMKLCIDYGIKISGINAEVAPFQWEFQVGPCEGIHAADQLWIARYLLYQIAENNSYDVILSPKLVGLCSEINGSGCHANFSTLNMRTLNTLDTPTTELYGIDAIMNAISKLKVKHESHMLVYGENNNLRMTGNCETADYNVFSYGIGTRTTSVRIPNEVARNGMGYLEDRRPASNNDPYLVTAILAKTIILDDT